MKVYKTDIDNTLFAGDIHGQFEDISSTISRYSLSDCNIIVCGDIGIGFEKEEYYNQMFNRLSKSLSKHNVHLYMLRGNHDNKTYFDGEHFTNFELINIISDYSIIQTPTRNILCIGGGISIDRTMRKINMEMRINDYMRHHTCLLEDAKKNIKQSYWEDETIVYDENELSQIEESGIKIDTICTHTGPSFTYPTTKDGITYWLALDKNLETDLDAERYVCDLIVEYMKEHNHPLKNWYYGHFHYHTVEEIDDIKYTLLDMSRGKLDLV